MFIAVITATPKTPGAKPTVQYNFLGETANEAVKLAHKTFEQLLSSSAQNLPSYDLLVGELTHSAKLPEVRFTLVPLK